MVIRKPGSIAESAFSSVQITGDVTLFGTTALLRIDGTGSPGTVHYHAFACVGSIGGTVTLGLEIQTCQGGDTVYTDQDSFSLPDGSGGSFSVAGPACVDPNRTYTMLYTSLHNHLTRLQHV